MTTQCESLMCGGARLRKGWRLGPKQWLKIAAALGIASAVMYGETWAIEQAPIWSAACAPRPAQSANGARGANSNADGILRDTAGPVAVLH